MPFATFFYCMFWKRCILDGRQGLYFSLREMLAETMIALRVLEVRMAPHSKDAPDIEPEGYGTDTALDEQACEEISRGQHPSPRSRC
jgi:hypothetical protein